MMFALEGSCEAVVECQILLHVVGIISTPELPISENSVFVNCALGLSTCVLTGRLVSPFLFRCSSEASGRFPEAYRKLTGSLFGVQLLFYLGSEASGRFLEVPQKG